MSRFSKSRFNKSLVALATLSVAVVALTGCGGSTTPSAAGSAAAPTGPLKVVADADPHTTLLKKTEELGLLGDVKLEIREIAGGVDPNQLVASGDVEANFFQHIPYLDNWNAEHQTSLVSVAAVHIEPLGLYSKKVATVADTPDGAVIAIPADATNQARALFLLADAGLVTLDVKASDEGLDFAQVSERNITGNPKNVSFLQIERPQLAATLDDPQVTLSVVNGNYALEAGLIPSRDAKFLETAVNNPYVNVLVVAPQLQDDPRVNKLAEALTSDEIAQFITDTYQGSVLPAKG